MRKSIAPHDKGGAIVYYIDGEGFIRKSTAPHDKGGTIVYYIDGEGFIRKSTAPHDKGGAIVYYIDGNSFVRKSTAPHDKGGAIVYYIQAEQQQRQEKQDSADEKKGVLLLIAFVLGLIFAPILIVLGMFGKFLLGGLFKNVLPIKAFKKFRKGYSILNFVWLGLGIAAVTVLAILQVDATILSIPLYALVGGNILLFILSIVIGNKIYNEHKHELPQPVEEFAEYSEDGATTETDAFGAEQSSEAAKEQSGSFDTPPADAIQKNLHAIKQLKELLDMGAITQAEFNQKKNVLLGVISAPAKTKTAKELRSNKGLHTTNLVLSIFTIITFIVGIVFLLCTKIEYCYRYDYIDEWGVSRPYYIDTDFSYLQIGFNLCEEFEFKCLFAVIGAILSAICLVVQFILDCRKKKNATALLIVDILTILSLTVAIVFGFLSMDGGYGVYRGDVNGGSYVYVNRYFCDYAQIFSILFSSACCIALVHLIISLIIKGREPAKEAK